MSDRANEVTTIRDPLQAALRAVPLRAQRFDGTWEAAQEGRIYQATEPDYPALAAAAREWTRQAITVLQQSAAPGKELNNHQATRNVALADVAGRLGL